MSEIETSEGETLSASPEVVGGGAHGADAAAQEGSSTDGDSPQSEEASVQSSPLSRQAEIGSLKDLLEHAYRRGGKEFSIDPRVTKRLAEDNSTFDELSPEVERMGLAPVWLTLGVDGFQAAEATL